MEELQEIVLKRDKQDASIFRSGYLMMSKETIQWIKDEDFLHYIILEEIPTQFTAEVIINLGEDNTNKPTYGIYTIEVYTEWVATERMKEPIFAYKNRDIEIERETSFVSFSMGFSECTSLIRYNEEKDTFVVKMIGVMKPRFKNKRR